MTYPRPSEREQHVTITANVPEFKIDQETVDRLAASINRVTPILLAAAEEWARQIRAFVALLASLAAEGNDPDEPTWLDASRPDPDAEPWVP